MHFVRRKDFIIAGIFLLLFITITNVVPYFLITRNVIYDKVGITMKSAEMARMLSWPMSSFFSLQFVVSYYFLPIVFLFYLMLVVAIRWMHYFLRSKKLYRWVLSILLLVITVLRINPNLLLYLENEKPSMSIGGTSDGALINGKRIPFDGPNFQYFNFISYLKGYCFVHDKVKSTLLDTYRTCEKTCAGIKFVVGEGSKKGGGTFVLNHRTHQNGTSIDLQLVFKKDDQQYEPNNAFNAYGYGLDTDNKGVINGSMPINYYPKNTVIDFETNARFLLALDDACHKNGIKIKTVVLKLELKPHLFATPSGKKLLARNIHFATVLSDLVNKAHDEHFHVDFDVSEI